MTNIVGLSKARKLRAQAKRKEQADLNSVKFGRTKEQKILEANEALKARKMLDAHRTDKE